MISFLPSILKLVLSADEESCFSTLVGPVLLVELLPMTRLLSLVLEIENACDAPKSGYPLTTHQPVEY